MVPRRLLSGAVTLLLLLTLPSPAQADPPVAPAAGRLEVEGRGYGHGRGLSQWGAYGAATKGLTWRQILAFYYPGTRAVTEPDSPIRVLVSADGDGDTRVVPAAGLRLVSGTATETLPVGSSYDGWRLRRSGERFVLERLDGNRWRAHQAAVPLTGPVGFAAPGLLRLVLPDGSQQELRGQVRAVPSGSGQRTVAVLRMDDYLRGVVPAEMPASWPAEALRSQAVAARTYAARLRDGARAGAWDTCDTVSCQVFSGTARYRADGRLISRHEHPAADAAVLATAGVVLRFRDGLGQERLALTEFSASNGGWKASGGTSHPYLAAGKDPYDGVVPSAAHAWTTTVQAATVEAREPRLGRLLQVRVLSRSGDGELGGRVRSAELVGSAGSVTLTGAEMRSVLGLRSDWFVVRGGAPFSRDWDADARGDVLAVSSRGSLVLYSRRGSGFAPGRAIGRGWSGSDLVTQAGDWDRDGAGDLLARTRRTGELRLYRGDGRGGFRSSAVLSTGGSASDVILAPGDWDGDGRADVLSRRASDGRLLLHPGTPAGQLGPAVSAGVRWGGLDLLAAVGDWDGDGAVDLLARRAADAALWLYPGNGSGGFRTPRRIGDGAGLDALVPVGDWDQDGDADVLARRGNGRIQIALGDGTGSLRWAPAFGRGWGALRVLG